jgi:hypothetical protein
VAFRKFHVTYRPCEELKSTLYVELLPTIHGGRCELLGHARLRAQLLGLERRTGRGTGRDVVDHAPRAHDDLANAAAGALFLLASEARRGRAETFNLSDLVKEGDPPRPEGMTDSHYYTWLRQLGLR